MKRLTDMERGVERLYAGIAPLVGSPKLGPVLWQLPGELPPRRRPARVRARAPPAGPPLLRVPPPELVLQRGLRPAAHVRRRARGRRRRAAPAAAGAADGRLDADPLPLRRARPARELLRDRAARVGGADRASCAREAEVLAYFNNDWEGFAVRNGAALEAAAGGLKPGSPVLNCGCPSDAGWSSQVARRAHNPKVAGSNPAPAMSLRATEGTESEAALSPGRLSSFRGQTGSHSRGGPLAYSHSLRAVAAGFFRKFPLRIYPRGV